MLALAAGAAAALMPPSCGIEGAYFNRSVDSSGGVFAIDGGMCWAPDVFTGAAAAFALCAVAMAVADWRLRRPAAS